MARITLILTPDGHLRGVFCDQSASVVSLRMVDIARAGGDIAYNLPEGSRALDETAIPVGQQTRVRREHELALPTPSPRPQAKPEPTVSLTGKSAAGFAAQCESEGLNPGWQLRQLAATWRNHRKQRVPRP